MEFNAQTAGIRPGGLNNTEQIKLLICHILSNFENLDLNTLLDAVYSDGLANSFEMERALTVLSEKGMIVKTEKESRTIYNITPEGKANYSELVHLLPKSIREDSLTLVENSVRRKKRLGETRFWVVNKDNECHFNCAINDGTVDLMVISLLVPNEETAMKLKENVIENNPAFIYKSIISLLNNDIESFLEYYDRSNVEL